MRRARQHAGWIVLAFALLPAGPALAQAWAFRPAPAGGAAGFVADGQFSGLWLACTASGARLTLSTGGTRLQAGVDQTAVVAVDGTAFLQRMRAGVAEGTPVLQRPVPPIEFKALADALAKGRKAEVAMPAGRFVLPLKGSGKALASLVAACG